MDIKEYEKAILAYMKQTSPVYTDIEYYFTNVCQDIVKVAQEDYFGSSDIPIMAERCVKLKRPSKFIFLCLTVDQIAKAISNREIYLKIVKKGFKKSTETKDIAQKIYEKIKADEGGFQEVGDYFDSF